MARKAVKIKLCRLQSPLQASKSSRVKLRHSLRPKLNLKHKPKRNRKPRLMLMLTHKHRLILSPLQITGSPRITMDLVPGTATVVTVTLAQGPVPVEKNPLSNERP